MMQIEEALFQYYTAPEWVKPELELVVFNAIIAFRSQKSVSEEDRARITRAIACYNNRLHRRRS